MLPTSRNRTYSGITNVASGDLNDIQDAIIANKHGEIEFGLHGAAWAPEGAGYTYNGSIWTPPAAGGTLVAALAHVGVGSTITQAKFGYDRANAGQVTYSLIRKPIGGGAAEVIATANDTATNGFATPILAAINHVVAADYGYALLVSFDNAAAAAGSALVGGSCVHERT